MLRNYFTTAVRNLLQHKLYSFINIGGLSIGFAACILIFLFVQNELSYDDWLRDGERVVRLEVSYTGEPGLQNNAMALSPGAMSKPLLKNFPNEIEAISRMRSAQFIFQKGASRLLETITLVDNSFFDVLDLPMVNGDRSLAFQDYRSLIISERMAQKYFGDTSPVGETMDLDNGDLLVKVVAVMKDLPRNTHFSTDFILQLDETQYDEQPWMLKWWNSSNFYTYLKLKDIQKKEVLEASIPKFADANSIRNPSASTASLLSEFLTFSLMPVRDIHLYSKGRFQLNPTGDIIVVYSFSLIAILILIIAIINFTNLSTARASMRAREIAVRKVVGATRGNIISQFLGETFLTTLIALLLAFTIVELCIGQFNVFVGKLLNLGVFTDPVSQIGLAGLIAVVGLSAGAHPAFSISRFQPAKVLHSSSSASHGAGKFRFALTTIQFTISIGLMIGTAVVYSQVQHAQNMDSGFNKEHKLALSNMNYGPLADLANTLETEIANLPGVIATSFSDRTIPLNGYWDWPVKLGTRTDDEIRDMEIIPSDFGLLDLYEAKLIAGRLFSEDRPADLFIAPKSAGELGTQAGIINENAVKYLGFPSAEEAVGQTIYIERGGTETRATNIVGVVADMQLRSARDDIDPTVFLAEDDAQFVLYIDLNPETIPETVAAIEAIWNNTIPELPFSRFYVKQMFDQFYQADKQRADMFAYFSIFAIFVSCLGLYGLASFTTERRTKEIGIRKVMGANVSEIVKLLVFQFSKPVLVANLIAWPMAWYFTHGWLQSFTHRIDLNILYFVVAGSLALIIACATVASHAIRVAKANPVDALKSE